MDNKKSVIYDFAKQYNLCVLSTTVENIPESAVLDYVITEDLIIYFNSYVASRKYKNLLINPRVSVVIGFGETLKTLQCSGNAEALYGHEAEKVASELAETLIFSRRWKNKEMRYFRIRLDWVRLMDFTDFPPSVIELDAEEI